MRLYICGEIVGEKVLTSLMNNGTTNSDHVRRRVSLFSVGGDGYSVQGFIHCAEVLPSTVHVNNHYTKVISVLSLCRKKDSCPCVCFFHFAIHFLACRTHLYGYLLRRHLPVK